MNNSDTVYNAISRMSDDRGFCRTTRQDLALVTGLSVRTVERILEELAGAGLIQKRSKRGQSGGLLLRVSNSSPNSSPNSSQTRQLDELRNAFTQAPAPKGPGAGGLLPDSNSSPNSPNPRREQPVAYRPTAPADVPESGAELLYTGPEGSGHWYRLSPTLWHAPNGDTVSIRSMTPELRLRLRVHENDDGTPNLAAIKAIRGILDR